MSRFFARRYSVAYPVAFYVLIIVNMVRAS